jgi:hypothetical protein
MILPRTTPQKTDVEKRLKRLKRNVENSQRKVQVATVKSSRIQAVFDKAKAASPEAARKSTLRAARQSYFRSMLYRWYRIERNMAKMHQLVDVVRLERSLTWRVFIIAEIFGSEFSRPQVNV